MKCPFTYLTGNRIRGEGDCGTIIFFIEGHIIGPIVIVSLLCIIYSQFPTASECTGGFLFFSQMTRKT